MSHKPNLLSWHQDISASPREFHETDNNCSNSAAWPLGSTFTFVMSGFRNFHPTKNYRKLFFPIFQMLCHSSKAKEVSRSQENYNLLQKITNKKIARHFENHWCMTWRHTGSDQSTNRELKHARFWDADGNRKWAVFPFNLFSHNHIYNAKYLFSIRDD